jgi:hypothetical protein
LTIHMSCSDPIAEGFYAAAGTPSSDNRGICPQYLRNVR